MQLIASFAWLMAILTVSTIPVKVSGPKGRGVYVCRSEVSNVGSISVTAGGASAMVTQSATLPKVFWSQDSVNTYVCSRLGRFDNFSTKKKEREYP